MRTLGIDYGDARVGIAVTDALGITAQGLETIHHNGNDKVILKRLDEIFAQYEVDTIVVGMPLIWMELKHLEQKQQKNLYIN